MAWIQLLEVPYSKMPYRFDLHGLSDLQLGSRSTIKEILQMRVEEILESPHDSGTVITGDIEDEDRPSTRAMRKAIFADREEVIDRDARKHMTWIRNEVVPLLLPLQKTKYGIVAVLAGHHWTQLSPALNSVQYICHELGRRSGRRVPYVGEMSAFLDLRFKLVRKGPLPQTVRRVVHLQHGVGAGQARGSALRKLSKASNDFIADCYIRGHDCQVEAAKFSQLYPKESRGISSPGLGAKKIAVMNLGSATQGYEITRGRPAYPEMGMMTPTAMDWGSLKFRLRWSRFWEEDIGKAARPTADVRIEI